MGKHKNKKKLKNSLKMYSEHDAGKSEIPDFMSLKQPTISHKGKVESSLWDFLTSPENKKAPSALAMPKTHVESNISLSEIPTAKMLLDEGNLTRRQKKFFFLKNEQVAHLIFSPKVLVRKEYIADDPLLDKQPNFNSFTNFRECVYLVPNLADHTKTDVLVLTQKYAKTHFYNQPEEATLILYPNGSVQDAVSIFRFDVGHDITHSSKRFVNKRKYYLNNIKGSHFHTTSEEEELNHEFKLSLGEKVFGKEGDRTIVFGNWFASKIELKCGYTVETLYDFLKICKNDFNFGEDVVEIDAHKPIKDIDIKSIISNTSLEQRPTSSFNLVMDNKTVDFIKKAKYRSQTLGNNGKCKQPSMYLAVDDKYLPKQTPVIKQTPYANIVSQVNDNNDKKQLTLKLGGATL